MCYDERIAAAKMPVKFQNDLYIFNSNLHAHFLQWYRLIHGLKNWAEYHPPLSVWVLCIAHKNRFWEDLVLPRSQKMHLWCHIVDSRFSYLEREGWRVTMFVLVTRMAHYGINIHEPCRICLILFKVWDTQTHSVVSVSCNTEGILSYAGLFSTKTSRYISVDTDNRVVSCFKDLVQMYIGPCDSKVTAPIFFVWCKS